MSYHIGGVVVYLVILKKFCNFVMTLSKFHTTSSNNEKHTLEFLIIVQDNLIYFEHLFHQGIKIILKKLYNLGSRNLLIEGGDELTNSLIKHKIFNKFYLFKSSKNLSKSSEYLKFKNLNVLKQKYKKKVNLNLNLRKDKIILYKS